LTPRATARTHKEQGNLAFKRGLDFQFAAREYKRALHCMRRVKPDVATRAALEKELRLPCYLNLAACDLELGNHADAERHANKALGMDPNNIKALYRRAMSRKHAARNLQGALRDLNRAGVLAPDDRAVKAALQSLVSDLKRAEDAERLAAQRMFAT
jgi:tetratricopeptide (TPR) repeat protein